MNKVKKNKLKTKDLSLEELKQKIFDSKKELFSLRFKKVLKEMTDTSRFRLIRKDIARMNTKLNYRVIYKEQDQ